MTAISRSRPYGIGLYPTADRPGDSFVLSIKLARLWARVLSATDLVMIFTAPYWSLCLCRTTRTREQPPLPIVLPSCQCPIYVLRLTLDAVVEVAEMAELRLESRASSLAMRERCLFFGDIGYSLLRTVRLPLGSKDSLWGRLEEVSPLTYLPLRCEGGGLLMRFLSSSKGRLAVGRLARYRSAMGSVGRGSVSAWGYRSGV